MYYFKEVCPPDYLNVPSVRDWQMSPFSNERYDLDEIQKAERKGVKGKQELEELKKKYGLIPATEPCTKPNPPEDVQNENPDKMRKRCTSEYQYQPYGPPLLSTLSYNRPDLNQPRLYNYLGPSYFVGPGVKTPIPRMCSIIPCSGLEYRTRILSDIYVPYGPYEEVRLTQDQYVPLGPSPYRL